MSDVRSSAGQGRRVRQGQPKMGPVGRSPPWADASVRSRVLGPSPIPSPRSLQHGESARATIAPNQSRDVIAVLGTENAYAERLNPREQRTRLATLTACCEVCASPDEIKRSKQKFFEKNSNNAHRAYSELKSNLRVEYALESMTVQQWTICLGQHVRGRVCRKVNPNLHGSGYE